MAAPNEVKIKLALEGADKARAELGGVEQQLDRFTGALARVGHYGAGLLLINQGLAPMAQATVRAADAVTTLQNSLKLATGSAQAAAQAYEELFGIAQRSRVSFTELGGTFASISRAGSELGISQARLLSVTEAIGNAMTIGGGSAQSMNAALIQLSQGLASGTLRGDELNSVMEQAPRLAQALADGLGITRGELRKLGEAGEITAVKVIEALEGQAAVLKGEVAGATLTVSQAFTMLSNAAVKLVGDADAATGATRGISGALAGLAKHLDIAMVATGALAGLYAGKMAQAMAAGAAAAMAERAARVAALQSTVAQTEAVAIHTGMILRDAQATLAHTTGLGASVVAQNAVMAARVKDTAAIAAQTAAQAALTGATSVGARALGLLGGPVGIITTLLGLGATAWALWGSSSAKAIGQAEQTLFEKADAFKAELREQIALLDRRNAARNALPGGVKSDKAAENLGALQAEIDRLRNQKTETYAQEAARVAQLQAALRSYGETVALVTDHEKKQEAAQRGSNKTAADALLLKLSGVPESYIKDMQELIRLNQAGEITGKKYTDALAKMQAALLKKTDATQDSAKAAREAAAEQKRLAQEEQKRLDDILASAVKVAEARQDAALREAKGIADFMLAQDEAASKSLKSVSERIGALEAEEKAVALARAQNVSLAEAVEMVTIARLKEEQAAKYIKDGEAWKAVQREIEERERLLGLIGFKSAREADEKAAKDAADAWQRSADQIHQSLSDALMNAFTSGKGFAKTFVDSVKAMFNSMVLKPVISAIVSPVSGAITSALGFSGAANAASGAGALGNVGSLAGLAGSAGAFGSGLASGLTAWGAEGSVMGLLGSGSSLFAGGLANGMGVLAGALAPVALGIAAVYALAKKLDNSGTPHTGGGSAYSAAGGLLDARTSVFNSGFTGIAYSDSTTDMTAKLVQSIVGILDTTATTFGKTAGYQAAASFADDSSKDGAWGSLFIKNLQGVITDWQAGGQSFRTFSDGSAGSSEYLAAISADVRRAIDGIGLPAWATSMLDKLGDAPTLEQLASVATEITATQKVLESLGTSVKAFAGLSGEAVLNIISASGGLQAFSASIGAYYENFYSEQEKFDAKLQALNTRLQDLAAGGAFADSSAEFYRAITEPTRENFRKLVEAQDLTTASGQTTYAALIGLSGVVAELTPVAEQAAEAVQTLGEAALTLADVQKLFDSQANTLLNTAEYSAYRIQQIQATLGAAGMALSAQQITHLTREQVLAGYQQALAAGNIAAAGAILNVVDALVEVSAGFQGVTAESASAATAIQQVVTTLADVQTQFGSAARTLLNDVQYTAYQVAQIQATLGSVGINVTAADIQNATKEQVLAGLAEMMAAGNLDAARAILSVVGALSEVSSGFQTVAATASNAAAIMQQRAGLESTLLNLTGNTAEIRARELAALDASNRGLQQHIYAIQDAQQAVQAAQQAVTDANSAYAAQESAINNLQSAAQRWIGTMATASSLLDQISGSLGGAGGNREAALWATVNGAGDIDARLSAAQELYGLITQTAATEQAAQDNALANAKALLEYGQRLRDYVQGLKTGDLSTLTPAQKVAEALAQYQTTLAAARGGDQKALGNLQGVADTYLRLAREFDPASYTASVFTSVTSALDSLGAGLISQNQPQIDLLQSQLDATNAASASANALSADQIARLQTLQSVVQDLSAQAAAQSAIANAQVSSAQANLQALGAAQLAAQQNLALKQQALVDAQAAATAYMATLADVAVTDPVPEILRSLPEGIAAALAPLLNANPASTAAASAAAVTAQRAQIIRDYAATLPQDDTGARMLYDAAVANGVGSAELDAAMGFAPGSSLAWAVSHGLPAFAQGTNYVPRDMVAMVHQGEAIVPARYNPANGGNAELVAEIKALREEVRVLREQNNAGHQLGAMATHENTQQITRATVEAASRSVHAGRLKERTALA